MREFLEWECRLNSDINKIILNKMSIPTGTNPCYIIKNRGSRVVEDEKKYICFAQVLKIFVISYQIMCAYTHGFKNIKILWLAQLPVAFVSLFPHVI